MKKIIIALLTLIILAEAGFATYSVATKHRATITVSKTAEAVTINDNLLGVFFEDISFGADGGLSSNIVCNGSFEYSYVERNDDDLKKTGWNMNADLCSLTSTDIMNATNPTALCVTLNGQTTEVINYGYFVPETPYGIYTVAGHSYELSLYANLFDFKGSVSCYLRDANGTMVTNKALFNMPTECADEYTDFSAVLQTETTAYTALVVEISGTGTALLDMFSLRDSESFGHDNEAWQYSTLRADLVEAINELSPAFLRFPGGCCAEGAFDYEYMYHWKNTIGELSQRKQTPNVWGYNQSYDLGYYEYFLLSEYLGATPIPVIPAGLMCQGRFGDWARENWNDDVAMDTDSAEFAALVQDTLDLVEYAMGDVTTTWGAVRAANGHPEPFELEYIAIGNENWDEVYWERFDVFYDAIKAAYPDLKIISSAGPGPWGDMYELAWDKIDTSYRDTVVDEHYYLAPWDMVAFEKRYDSYDRESASVFVGEYASNIGGDGINRNTWLGAISEAVYLTGILRNGDIVELAAYAPLFARKAAYQWAPDMIWFDSESLLKTPNYYVQQLFMKYHGNTYLHSTSEGDTEGLYRSVTVDDKHMYIHVVNNTDIQRTIKLNTEGYALCSDLANVITLSNSDLSAYNSFEKPFVISPTQAYSKLSNGSLKLTAEPFSVNVIVLDLE